MSLKLAEAFSKSLKNKYVYKTKFGYFQENNNYLGLAKEIVPIHYNKESSLKNIEYCRIDNVLHIKATELFWCHKSWHESKPWLTDEQYKKYSARYHSDYLIKAKRIVGHWWWKKEVVQWRVKTHEDSGWVLKKVTLPFNIKTNTWTVESAG